MAFGLGFWQGWYESSVIFLTQQWTCNVINMELNLLPKTMELNKMC